MSQRTITWDAIKLAKLRGAYDLAVKQRTRSFSVTIDGIDTDFDVGYAKHLIEYLDGRLKPARPAPPNREGEESTSASSTDGENWQ